MSVNLSDKENQPLRPSRPPIAPVITLAIILAVGAFLRLYRIDSLPPGLHQDEAVYGLHSLSITLGNFRLYYGEREPLYEYLVALVSFLAGPTPLALHLTSAILGTGVILGVFLAGRSLGGSLTGLIAAAVVATSLWAVMVSRVGFRAGSFPFVLAFAAFSFLEAWKKGGRLRWGLAGVLSALTLYTYLAGRFWPVVLALFLASCLIFARRELISRWRGLALMIGAAFVTFLPLGVYFLRHPEAFFGRPAQVASTTAASSDGATVGSLTGLVQNALKTAGMFFTQGDLNWRHNLSGEPALLLPIALLMVLGYLVCLTRFRRPESLLLVVWLPVMLLPGALSIDAPHYLRTLGALPAAALLVGVGAVWLVERLALLLRGRFSRQALAGAAVALALFPGITTYSGYFGLWATLPESYRAFNVALASLGQELARSPVWRSGDERVFVSDTFRPDRASATFFLWPYLSREDRLNVFDARLNLRWFDESRALPIPSAEMRGKGEYLYLLDSSVANSPARLWLEKLGLGFEDVVVSPLVLPGYTKATLKPETMVEPEKPLVATGGGLSLVGYTQKTTGVRFDGKNRVEIALFWRLDDAYLASSNSAPRPKLDIFCHLIDDALQTVATADGGPGYEPAEARPGDTLVTFHRLTLPDGAPPGEYSVEVGLYDLASGKREPLSLADRVDSRVTLTVLVDRGALADSVRPESKPLPKVELDRPVGSGLRLFGHDDIPTESAPGSRLPLTLFWRADEKLVSIPRYAIGLRSQSGQESLSEPRAVAGGRLANTGLEKGETVRDAFSYRIPGAAENGPARLFLRTLDTAGKSTGDIELGEIVIKGQPRLFDRPEVEKPVGADFSEGGDPTIRLVGYRVEKSGNKLRLTLYWQALGEPKAAYTVFTHLLDSSEKVVSQSDSQPVGGARPTTGWVAGEYVVDAYELAIPPAGQSGEYRIEVGIYDGATGTRLPASGSDERPTGDRVLFPEPLRLP